MTDNIGTLGKNAVPKGLNKEMGCQLRLAPPDHQPAVKQSADSDLVLAPAGGRGLRSPAFSVVATGNRKATLEPKRFGNVSQVRFAAKPDAKSRNFPTLVLYTRNIRFQLTRA